MSFVDQVKLILWKDVRRLWWALAIVAVILQFSVIADLYTPWEFEDNKTNLPAYSLLSSTLTQGLLFLTNMLIAGLLIHQDPPVGPTPYWKTRPLRPGALIAAKVIFVAGFLALTAALADLIVLARFGLDPWRWLPRLAGTTAAYTLGLAGPAAIAVVAPSLPLYLLGMVGAGVVWIVSAWIWIWTAGGQAPVTLMPTLLAGLASVWVIWRQYHRRDSIWSIAIVAAALVLAPVGYIVPSMHLPGGERVKIAAISPGLESRPQGRLMFPVQLDLADMERGIFHDPIGLSGELLLRDGGRIRGRGAIVPAMGGDPRATVRSAFPGFEWYGHVVHPTKARRTIPVLLQTTGRGQSIDWTSFRGTVVANARRFRRVGAAKPEKGARIAGGSMRLDLMDMRRTGYSVIVDLRASEVGESFLFQGSRSEILLVQPSRKLVVRPNEPADSDRRKSRLSFLMRASGSVLLSRREFEFPLPKEVEQDLLADFELQLWMPEDVGRVTSEIEVRR